MPIFSMFQVGRPKNLLSMVFKKLGLAGILPFNIDLPLAGKARILAVVAGGACNMMLALAIV